MKLLISSLFFLLCSFGYSQELNPNGYNKFYFPSGKLSSEGNLKEGKPDAYWKSYYETGILKSEGNRVNFLLDGVWKFYNVEGNITQSITYKNGKKNGIKKIFSNDGTCLIEESFIDDIKSGIANEYFNNGNLQKTYLFENGQIVNTAYEYDTLQNIITLLHYRKGFIERKEEINRFSMDHKKQGTWKIFYDNFSVKEEGFYRNGLKDGVYKYYKEDETLDKIEKYEKGVLLEEAEEIKQLKVDYTYYQNGKVASSGSFDKGKPVGTHRKFNNDGSINSSLGYNKNGKLTSEGIVTTSGIKNGPWKEYYPSGEIKLEGTYFQDIKVEKWKYYYENGQLEQEGKYNKKGQPIGFWKWYYDTGSVEREENYINGLENDEMIEYHPNGSIRAKGSYIDGYKEGPWIYQNGDQREEGSYQDGLLHGVWKEFYSNDQLKFIGEYAQGMPQGKHKYYYMDGTLRKEGSYSGGKKDKDWRIYSENGEIDLVITYKMGIDIRVNGIKVDPVVEEE